MTAPLVILGSGLAGYHVAREFRKLDKTTPLLLFTADSGDYYSKPMLSNALSRSMEPEQLAMAGPERMAEQLKAEIRPETPVDAVDPVARSVQAAGMSYPYARLVLAVGARPVPLPAEGDALGDVCTVNSLDDYRRFRRAVSGVRRVAVIGAGLIGCEFANDLRAAGMDVTVIGPNASPLERLLPPLAGGVLRAALEGIGIVWHLGVSARRIEHDGKAYAVTLSDGRRIPADIVMSAIGLRPDTRLAQEAGIDVNRGVIVDRWFRTSSSDIHAIGDCAEVEGRVLPFVMPIMVGARALARTLAGHPTRVVYPVMPVVVKTPAHPVVVAPPAPGSIGTWEEEETSGGVRALFRSDDGRLLGFALTGEACAEQARLMTQLPPVLG